MTIRIILLVTVVLFSSGFTTIVKYCSMSQSSECCCCESDHSDTTAAQTKEPSVSDQTPSCLTVKVIGGLNEIKAPGTSETSTKLLAVETIPLNINIVPLPLPAHLISLNYTDDCAPPNEDICIRISSLLI
jgi:hypothetical protein